MISPPAAPARLVPLLEYLDGLMERASIERVRSLLEESQVTQEDLADFVRFDEQHYRRNLVSIGPWYEILVICWLSGQRSPIHDHAESTCGLKVLSGVCTETLFEHSPCGQVVATRSSRMRTGQICASQDADTHQVSNVEGVGENLVTLHIYSPPLRAMKKFSIVSAQTEAWRPPISEFAQGGGI